MEHQKSFIKPFITGLIVFSSLIVGIIIKTNIAFDPMLILVYLITALLVGGFSYVMTLLDVKFGPDILLGLSAVMGFYLYSAMPTGQDGLSQLAAGIGWFFGMGIIIISLLFYTIIVYFNRKRK